MPGRTKIVCTIGPASRSVSVLSRMIRAGMDVARLNLSHGTHPEHAEVIRRVRFLSGRLGTEVAVLADLCGPKIRIRRIGGGKERVLARGEILSIAAGEGVPEGADFTLSHPKALAAVRPGERIMIADGAVELRAVSGGRGRLRARVVRGGKIREGKGSNFPDTRIPLPALTPKDRVDLDFALRAGADYVALSFVHHARDLLALRRAMGRRAVPVISKIELPEAMENLEEIVAASDGVMVARGDLGVETSLPAVPLHQKAILAAAARAGRLSITATQMLESMVDHARPTRAEAADVAGAVFDGSDAVMLSEETAIGAYSVEAVRAMSDIARAAEESPWRRRPSFEPDEARDSPRVAAARAACLAAEELRARAIVVFTLTGAAARSVARMRPRAEVLAVTPDPAVGRRLALVWGVLPVVVDRYGTADRMLALGLKLLRARALLRGGGPVVIVGGRGPTEETSYLIKILGNE